MLTDEGAWRGNIQPCVTHGLLWRPRNPVKERPRLLNGLAVSQRNVTVGRGQVEVEVEE